MLHFKSYLDGKDFPEPQMNEIDSVEERSRKTSNFVYLRKWMTTSNATFFRLSNRIVQVNFKDKTELMLNSQDKLVTYVEKNGDRIVAELDVAMENTNLKLVKRLKYTKDILQHL